MFQKKLNKLIFRLTNLVMALVLLIGCEGKEATELNKTVRTEHLGGLNLFLANLYNSNRLSFALLTTGTVIVFGLIVTYIIGLFINPKPHSHKDE